MQLVLVPVEAFQNEDEPSTCPSAYVVMEESSDTFLNVGIMFCGYRMTSLPVMWPATDAEADLDSLPLSHTWPHHTADNSLTI